MPYYLSKTHSERDCGHVWESVVRHACKKKKHGGVKQRLQRNNDDRNTPKRAIRIKSRSTPHLLRRKVKKQGGVGGGLKTEEMRKHK